MTQKTVSKKMIDLNTEISAKKTIVALLFEIDNGGMNTAIILVNQNIMMLFQIVVVVSKIRCLGIILFPLVFCLVDVITKEQYL